MMDQVLRARMEAALRESGRSCGGLSALALAKRLRESLPREHSELQVEALRILLDQDQDQGRAGLLNDCAIHLAALGHRERALAAAREAVSIARALSVPSLESESESEHPSSTLARTLDNLGCRLAEFDGEGERREAVTAGLEACELLRARVQAGGREDLRRDLAGALTNLGNRLTEAGQRGEAFEVAREAVDHYRKLGTRRSPEAATDPDLDLDLALALMNLGASYGDLNRELEALGPTREAIAIYRARARQDPRAPGEALALALHNLGVHLVSVEQFDQALSPCLEAVDRYRAPAEALETSNRTETPETPETPRPGISLVHSLTNLAACLRGLGRAEDALSPLAEAARVRAQLAHGDPKRFLPGLAHAHFELGNRASKVGRIELGIAELTQARAAYRQLSELDPGRYRGKLAETLGCLSVDLSVLERSAEALAASSEAVDLLRSIPPADDSTDPNVNVGAPCSKLAAALLNLAQDLERTGQAERAAAANVDAIDILRALAASEPDDFLPQLVDALADLALDLGTLGHPERARRAASEAVDHARVLVLDDPEYYAAALAQALDVRGALEGQRGEHTRALASLSEGLRLLITGEATEPEDGDPLARELAADLSEVCAQGALPLPPDLRVWFEARGSGS